MLNFHNELYEFYEWNKDDTIYHVKKIYLIKIDSIAYNDILKNQVILDDEFMLNIFNKCEYFDNKKVLTIPYAIIVTDSYRAMAIMMNRNGLIIKYSSLLLDEEEDILEVSDRLGTIKLKYKISAKKESNDLTRKEQKILKFIKKDLMKSYKEKDIKKLKYLYYECFNKENNNIDEIYNCLIKILDDRINEMHYNLYYLIKLSLMHKNV